MTGSTQVVVVGGGYAGVLAANRVTQHHGLGVTLVNPRPQFVERIRLHQFVAGTHTARLELREVLAPRVRLVVDEATRIHTGQGAIELGSGERLPYDHLVLATGSGGGTGRVPGSDRHALPMGGVEEAARLRRRLLAYPDAQAALESFRHAALTGDLQGLLDVLAPDAVMVTDGGGLALAARRPVKGADKLARWILGGLRKNAPEIVVDAVPAEVNGSPALKLLANGRTDGILTVTVEAGRIIELFYVRNPEKLTRVGFPTRLAAR